MVWELFLKSAKVSLFKNPRKKHGLGAILQKWNSFTFRFDSYFTKVFAKWNFFTFVKMLPNHVFVCEGFWKVKLFHIFKMCALPCFLQWFFHFFTRQNFRVSLFFRAWIFEISPDFYFVFDFPGFSLILRIFLDFLWFSWIYLDFPKFSIDFLRFLYFPLIFRDFPTFYINFLDFPRFP